jgi:CHASE2 domain-containing sensor protein
MGMAAWIKSFIWLILLPLTLVAGDFEQDFAVVFIDQKTEAKYGNIPLPRVLTAEVIERLTEAKAKAVVLKFFYDQPKDEAGDARLEKAIRGIPVALQARLDDSEKKANALPARFFIPEVKATNAISGTNGWIPLKRFTDHAKAVGFVDFTESPTPILETYLRKTVKSLILCSLELALGEEAVIQPGQKVFIGNKSLALDEKNQRSYQLPKTDDLKYIPFHAVLDGSAPMKTLEGKVVIIGYHGPHIHTFDSPAGKLGAHQAFVYALRSTYQQMKEK